MIRPQAGSGPALAAAPAARAAGGGLVVHLARFGGALRRRGVAVGISDEADGLEALSLVDLGDRDEVRRALRAALKIRPRDAAAFAELFAEWFGAWAPIGPSASERPAAPRREHPARLRPPSRSAGLPLPGPERELPPAGAPECEVPAGEEPGYSPEAQLRRKDFAECSAADLAAMEHLMDQLARRLATRPSRRRVPAPPGAVRGEPDLRRSFRLAVPRGGELLTLARRRRAIERPRLVVLCDTSGSMDPYTRFLLGFVLALRRVARRSELFAFNTALVRLTPWLQAARARSTQDQAIGRVLRRLADDVPGWSGGTRIGECLAEFADHWLHELVDARTVVLILSDGLDRGDVRPLAAAMRAIHGRARQVLWLNPLAGDRRYEPTARAMAAALPHVDRLLPAHNLESLERLLPCIAA